MYPKKKATNYHGCHAINGSRQSSRTSTRAAASYVFPPSRVAVVSSSDTSIHPISRKKGGGKGGDGHNLEREGKGGYTAGDPQQRL
ncbi:hypothetical protein B0T13DRAFT_483632 [Neurospora crassa]|nr:hypothetical protein B0T13DRAFT_483632 [Neurospora crassa]